MKKSLAFLIVSAVLLTACAQKNTEPELLEIAYPPPSGELILGTSLDECGRINSTPYRLEDYFENHPFNENIYDFYVYREDEYLDFNYWYGYNSNAAASLLISAEIEDEDSFNVEWIYEDYQDEENEDGSFDVVSVDVLVKKHKITSLQTCDDGSRYVSSSFDLATHELLGMSANFRVDFYYNDNLVTSKRFTLDGVQ